MAAKYERPLSLDIDGFDFDIIVSFNYTPSDPGICSGPPEKCYPPEASEVDIHDMWMLGEDGKTRVDISGLLENIDFSEYIEQEIDELICSEEPDEGPEPDDDFDDDYYYYRFI